ncbi:MAG: cellulose biosynthesis protein BcsS [Bradyrhizobium sp.]
MKHWFQNAADWIVPACLLAGAVARPAAAADHFDALTGVDVGGHSTYEYVGGIAGLAGPLSQSGPLVRLWADHLTYDFTSGTTKVTAKSWGENASLGYQFVYATGLVSGYAGINSRTTTMPTAIVSREKGSKTNARLEADWFQQLPYNLRTDAIGNLVTGTGDYWTRARLLYQTNLIGIAVGPETIWQGNPDYKVHRFGLAAEAPLCSAAKATVDFGYEKNSHFSSDGYGGAHISVMF